MTTTEVTTTNTPSLVTPFSSRSYLASPVAARNRGGPSAPHSARRWLFGLPQVSAGRLSPEQRYSNLEFWFGRARERARPSAAWWQRASE
ncbi:hypothetical protein ACFFQF_15865 [Haladaptatus pallidirubidus]|uniref:hypothetical protein n=1 Tax=Haladaptatus pallidirubidus TaxID=1008152 RepID=UPI001D10C8AE|nr:hypothetical protein [Haladaptatus pallidirubidus]